MARFSVPRALLLVVVVIAGLYFTAKNFSSLASVFSSRLVTDPYSHGTCPPSAWNAGHWERRARPRLKGINDTDLTRQEDIFKYNGLQGCASDREFYWHLAAHERHFERFPAATEWNWVPGKGCKRVQPMTTEGLIKHLVEDGGWFLSGDSVTENHFFTLSCTLYPHVLATPNYTDNPYFDRAWPQNLYLNPDSPLVKKLDFPKGFEIAETPLVTFRRNDLLLTREQLDVLHRAKYPEMYENSGSGPGKNNFTLFNNEEQYWAHEPKQVWELFTAPAPKRYGTLFTNTGGHWTTDHLKGYHAEHAEGHGIRPLIMFFGQAMSRWAREVQALMDRERAREAQEHAERRAAGRMGRRMGKVLRREVVVRAYATGHEDCHNYREAWSTFLPDHAYRNKWYNWAWFEDMNELFQTVLSSQFYPDIHFLRIDRPQRLRPDAHGPADCLHLLTGSGVMEGWTHYLYHFLTRELPGHE